MNIVVCLKQVPDTQDIKWTDKGTMIREGVESVTNPCDEYALEFALKIKDTIPSAKITVVSMGPPQAEKMLRTAVAKGADCAVLATDKKFSGADTQATSLTLAHTIKNMVKDYDLIICGQFASDGDTAQTGPALAHHLGLEQITYVSEFIEITQDKITVQKEIPEGTYTIQSPLPLLICVAQSECTPRHFTIKGYINSYSADVKSADKETINISEEVIGFKGSPTCVAKTFTPDYNRKREVLSADSMEELCNLILEKVKID
ncbi:MAG: electron transfer flavoprotein subunit beta/FixA family protein [Candidatus Gastranaerophilales bacterium]|nr:electron transfer flavoprotein subunit beta/FixA family protein [Candidatus Gastranaerophilales bacterium]